MGLNFYVYKFKLLPPPSKIKKDSKSYAGTNILLKTKIATLLRQRFHQVKKINLNPKSQLPDQPHAPHNQHG
jgi:hypothetical protein